MAKMTPVMPRKSASAAKPKAVSVPDRQFASVSVRRIDNGYIISRSSEGPGGYKSSEEFSAQKPKIDIPVSAKPKAKK